jgi:hypothetical protein
MDSLRKVVVIIGLYFLTILNPIFATEFNWQDYQPYSIKQAIADFSHEPTSGYTFSGGFKKYKAKVVYLGKYRSIEKEISEFIALWGKAMAGDPKVTDSFKHEILVQEESQEYWLPIQEILLKPFEEEVKASKKTALFILYLGITNKKNHVFIINEFQEE